MPKRSGSKNILSKACGKEECCPVIKVSCRMLKKGRASDTFIGKDGKPHKYFYESKTPIKVCSVKVGKKAYLTDVPSQDSGKAIGALKQRLLARGCRGVVRSKGTVTEAATP